jgi:hypothetical protein
MVPPPPPPQPASPSSPPDVTSASVSSLNSLAPPFRSSGGSSSHHSSELPSWLLFSPSSSSSSESERQGRDLSKKPVFSKGKATLVDRSPLSARHAKPAAQGASSFMTDARRPQRPPQPHAPVDPRPEDDGWRQVIRKKKNARFGPVWC